MRTQEIVEAYGKTHIYMIGMDDNPQPKHIEVIIKNVKHDNIFSGGKRHYEIVKPFLPADAVWIEIKAPTMWVAEHLGNPKKEKIYKIYSIEEISEMSFTNPNCVLLMKAPNCALQRPALGIPDTKFILLNDRTKMITKAPIRVIDLSLLELHNSRYFWDIGACTGSVSIEARRQYPHLDIQAFEVRKECENIIRANTRLHSAPGIDLRIGNFLNLSIEKNTIVDAVFIGGHGGKLKEIIRKVASHLNSLNGKIVFNSVSEESSKLFREAVAENGLKLHSEINITLDSNNPITILCATGKNYV